VSTPTLEAFAAPGGEITLTVVPKGSETRIGIDHNLNGCYDGDEAVTCACPADVDHSGAVDGADAAMFIDAFVAGQGAADVDSNGFVNGEDFDLFVERYALGC